MALNIPNKEDAAVSEGAAAATTPPATQSADAAAPQPPADLSNVDMDDLDAEMEKLKAASPLGFGDENAEMDAAIAEISAPEVGRVTVFTCLTEPNSEFFVYPNAVDMRKRHIGDRITRKEDDPMAMTIKFNNGRFLTNDPRLAKLIEFSILAWPTFYGCISSSIGRTQSLLDRIEAMKAKAALQLNVDALADSRDRPLLEQASEHIKAENVAAAEALLAAVDMLQTQREKNSLQMDKVPA